MSLDTDLDRLKSFTQEHKTPWRQVCQGKKWESELVKLYGVRSIPFALLIGRDGKIAALDLSRLEFETQVQAALNGPRRATSSASSGSGGADCATCG